MNLRRDLIGFVDGTENPKDQAAIEATLISDKDTLPSRPAATVPFGQNY
jgi:deferrochelatase/peroxidase EfeB